MLRQEIEACATGCTGGQVVEACRRIARRPGQFFPTPGQIGAAVAEYRVDLGRQEREAEWQYREREQSRETYFTRGRSQLRDYEAMQDLQRRGHGGRGTGEDYLDAIRREERERTAAGDAWVPRRYGPPIETHGNLMRGYRPF